MPNRIKFTEQCPFELHIDYTLSQRITYRINIVINFNINITTNKGVCSNLYHWLLVSIFKIVKWTYKNANINFIQDLHEKKAMKRMEFIHSKQECFLVYNEQILLPTNGTVSLITFYTLSARHFVGSVYFNP